MPRSSALESLEVARALPLDTSYLRRIVEEISAIGSSPLGFRATGTPEDRQVAELVARELREIGLADVAIEPVEVDGWRFLGASLELVEGGQRFEAASLGGVPPTPAGGVTGPLVDAGNGERSRLDRMNVRGCIVLVDWARSTVSPSEVGLELGLRGALGMILSSPHNGPYYQAPGALGSFDSHWHAEAPPMITLRKEDVADLRLALTGGPFPVCLRLDVELARGTAGCNVVGYLPGEWPTPPIVVGAHHDGWFRAAFDNASGVATMLGMARALVESGHRPHHRICFTSRTAEEYGLMGSAFDWCTGAWQQVSVTHREWGASVPFHLCVEASGHPDLRLILETPPELVRFARAAARVGKAEGWLTSGWRIGPPITGTEQWPLLVSGIPGISAYTWEQSFARTDYHTQRDTIELLDFDHLERLARMYTLLLLEADRDPDGILDHPARAADLVRRAEGLGDGGAALIAAAERHGAAQGRAAFTRVGRKLLALDAAGSPSYPHEQAARDLAGLEAGLEAYRLDDHKTAAEQLARVGDNALARRLSERAFALHRARRQPHAENLSWARRNHLTASPNLWAELASLRAEPGAAAPGHWLERSLLHAIEATRADLARRLSTMERALAGPDRR
ncbi:MAG: M28 family peptidase [Gaiellales bacterium]